MAKPERTERERDREKAVKKRNVTVNSFAFHQVNKQTNGELAKTKQEERTLQGGRRAISVAERKKGAVTKGSPTNRFQFSGQLCVKSRRASKCQEKNETARESSKSKKKIVKKKCKCWFMGDKCVRRFVRPENRFCGYESASNGSEHWARDRDEEEDMESCRWRRATDKEPMACTEKTTAARAARLWSNIGQKRN